MNSPLVQNWIPVERIARAVDFEPILFVLFSALSSFLVYKLALRNLNPQRHRSMHRHFRNLVGHILVASVFNVAFWVLYTQKLPYAQLLPYTGILALFWWFLVFIKTFRICAFEYLFFVNMQRGVPLLLVNILTLVVSLFIGSWLLTVVFEVRLAPILATSALFSIVLGLALQDTLGNLFSGVALQMDKPYSLGDWVEIQVGNQAVIGQVFEITWRATLINSFTDEFITIPNRIVAQSQVKNFSQTRNPALRGQFFRIPYGADVILAKKVLLESVEGIAGVRRHPEPLVLVMESTENWVLLKVLYTLQDFGENYLVADRVITRGLEALAIAGIPVARPRLSLHREDNV